MRPIKAFYWSFDPGWRTTFRMRSWSNRSAWLKRLIFATGLLVAGHCFPAESRTWTSSSGKKLEARMESLEDDTVYLVTPEGKHIRIPFNKLSEKDQDYITRQGSSAILGATLSAKSRAGEGKDTESQDLSIRFFWRKQDRTSPRIRIAFVSAGTGEVSVSFFGIRSKGIRGGYSNGIATYPLNETALKADSIDVGLTRFLDTQFIGYHVELLSGNRILDTLHWEDGEHVKALTQQLQMPADWWTVDPSGQAAAPEPSKTKPGPRR